MNPIEPSNRTYDTTDLSLASFLRCRNFTISNIRRQNGKTIFVFEDTPQLRNAVLEYANDGSVSVRTFCGTMRDLKAITR
jgi:ribosomal protein L30E